jgi:hypothetical protein
METTVTLRTTHPVLFWTLAVPLGLIAAFIAFTIALAVAQHPSGGILVILFLAAYWIPTIVAATRHHQVGLVAVLNALLAWTVIGWIVALAIACGDRRPGVVEVHHTAPPQP